MRARIITLPKRAVRTLKLAGLLQQYLCTFRPSRRYAEHQIVLMTRTVEGRDGVCVLREHASATIASEGEGARSAHQGMLGLTVQRCAVFSAATAMAGAGPQESANARRDLHQPPIIPAFPVQWAHIVTERARCHALGVVQTQTPHLQVPRRHHVFVILDTQDHMAGNANNAQQEHTRVQMARWHAPFVRQARIHHFKGRFLEPRVWTAHLIRTLKRAVAISKIALATQVLLFLQTAAIAPCVSRVLTRMYGVHFRVLCAPQASTVPRLDRFLLKHARTAQGMPTLKREVRISQTVPAI